MANKKDIEETNAKEKVVKIESAEEVLPSKDKEGKKSNAYLFGKAFGERLRTDKLFLFSFLITLIFIAVFSYKKLKNSESSYPNLINKLIAEDNKQSSKDSTNTNNKVSVDEKLDIADYVGIYSREVELNEKLKINDSCTIDAYKFIYQVKKDKTISKYLYNACLGSIKMWDDKLGYVTSGGTKYIGTEQLHFLFSGTSMKEVDGETYRIDDEFVSIREKNKIDGLYTYFFDNSIIFKNAKNLILLRGNSILFNLDTEYPSAGGKLDKNVFKTGDKTFKFIVFSNNEPLNCYDKEIEEDKPLYKIYSITYNDSTTSFDKPIELVARNINDLCTNWKEDYKVLST